MSDTAAIATPTSPSRDGWTLFCEALIPVINVAAFVCGLIIITNISFSARPACAAFLFLFGPGSGLVQIINRFDTAVRWILMIGLSVACSVLTAQLLLSIHELHSTPAAVILTLITASGVIARLLGIRIPESQVSEKQE